MPFLFLGPVLWIEYILLLSSPLKATSNCSLALALCSIHDFIRMLGGSLAKALLLLEMCLFFLSNSWALITKMWADCREASRDGLDPTGGTEGISWPSLGLKRREETGTWGESWV